MRYLTIIGLFFLISLSAKSQQLPRFQLFHDNLNLLNPAANGKSFKGVQTAFAFRQDWIDFEGAPSTQILSAHYRLNHLNMGLGAAFFNDVLGAERKTGVKLSYAYHIQLQTEQFFSAGLSLGLYQNALDFSRLDFDFQSDPVAFREDQQQMGFDIDLGALYYNTSSYLGLSILQAANNKSTFVVDSIEAVKQQVRHYHFMGGHEWDVSEKFSLIPHTLISSVDFQPVLVDVALRLKYDQKLWLGFAYRSEGAYGLSAGWAFAKAWDFSYAFQNSNSGLGRWSQGSHELLLRFAIPTKLKTLTSHGTIDPKTSESP